MKVLLVADEFFSWGIHGGFGFFSRKLGKELVKRGIEVNAIVQKISEQQKSVGETEVIDGVNVKTLPRGKFQKFKSGRLYKTDADVIHSQCGRLDTVLAAHHNKKTPLVVTIQDLRTAVEQYKIVGNLEHKSLFKRAWARYVDYLFGNTLKDAARVYVQADLLAPKLKEVLGYPYPVVSLHNFVDVPNWSSIHKSKTPSVVWLGRLDPIKRPQLALDLAAQFPDVDFAFLGASHDKTTNYADKYYGENVKFYGHIVGQEKCDILSKSWILVNTSIYEALPVSFLEAAAYGCAILSTQNPDNFTANHGIHCAERFLSNALMKLIEGDWKAAGESGYKEVQMDYSTEKVVSQHIDIYREVTK